MATIKLTNGFHDHSGIGNILTGTLVKGNVNLDERLFIDGASVPILKIETDSVTFPGMIMIEITVPKNAGIVWHKYYGRIVNTDKADKQESRG
ncbi:hypothetical protein [Chryseolinea lacunae]|uniref:Uncharacterized protein n=1 Tax=Chryseolinea lacunae TaxID=2801331 RepID=A0ABS1KPK6_9BACT|nr:hypothetical protein [Chryseolinea lacunae]MBL0741400.1 hypothetical protein [Chryseolinea lacunae]